ncbi:hypothetical protein SGPB_0890 [Streptococcus pasteurianus ATCC 43144]|uniref:Uncharacterized protein n=1 Tax=Streptococcus pasteurianus (strain ATCC 43144 / JCM 5346 / CCUG 46074 / CDC 1723-81) TaxID=981540 RepID=F5X6C7_STRPX|nr:hypothetical protein SGPB_0890 [Streptococcus pasteurianus ATCC 43144]
MLVIVLLELIQYQSMEDCQLVFFKILNNLSGSICGLSVA